MYLDCQGIELFKDMSWTKKKWRYKSLLQNCKCISLINILFKTVHVAVISRFTLDMISFIFPFGDICLNRCYSKHLFFTKLHIVLREAHKEFFWLKRFFYSLTRECYLLLENHPLSYVKRPILMDVSYLQLKNVFPSNG